MPGRNGSLIVFIGPGLTSFEQLAASARRKGVQTAWIGFPYSWMRRMRVRTFVAEVGSAKDVAGLAAELRRLGSHRISDIQASEYVLTSVVAAARMAQIPPSVLADLDRRLAFTDKMVMARTLAANGVLVPRFLDGSTVSPAEAVAKLGLPLVVKGRIGNGGTAVHIVDSLAGVVRASRQTARLGGTLYEQYVKGESVSYSASYTSDGTVLHDAVYLTRRLGWREVAPPDRVVALDNPAHLENGRTVLQTIGGSGLVNCNFIEDADGRAWIHDVNLRPWGTLLALREGGVDFAEDYLYTLGLSTVAPLAGALAVGIECDVFPSAALGLAETDLLAAAAVFASQLPRYLRWVGLDYVLTETLRSLAIVIRQRFRRWRRAIG